LLQSCIVSVNAYQTSIATIEEALIESKKTRPNTLKNIKVKSSTDQVFKFKSLTKEDEKIYGIAHKNWKTSELLSNQIVQFQGDKVKILLTKDQINEIYLKDYSDSNLLTFATGVATASLIFLGGWYISWTYF
jgi:16S rRNA C1402 (ribose-2'-O) methylase RsmI